MLTEGRKVVELRVTVEHTKELEDSLSLLDEDWKIALGRIIGSKLQRSLDNMCLEVIPKVVVDVKNQ